MQNFYSIDENLLSKNIKNQTNILTVIKSRNNLNYVNYSTNNVSSNNISFSLHGGCDSIICNKKSKKINLKKFEILTHTSENYLSIENNSKNSNKEIEINLKNNSNCFFERDKVNEPDKNILGISNYFDIDYNSKFNSKVDNNISNLENYDNIFNLDFQSNNLWFNKNINRNEDTDANMKNNIFKNNDSLNYDLDFFKCKFKNNILTLR